jgi:hypothetical protein
MSDIESTTTTPIEVAEVASKKTPTCIADLTLGNKKMHYFAIYVIKHLQDTNVFPKDYNPIDLPISLLESFDFKEVGNMFKPAKKTKATKNVVSANPPDIVQIVVQNSETLVDDIVSAAKPTKAKKETKPKAPKAKKVEEPVVVVADSNTEQVVAEEVKAEEKPKKVAKPRATKAKKVEEPVVVAEVSVSEQVVVTEEVKAEEKPKKEAKTKKEAKPKEPKAKKETKKKEQEVPVPEPTPVSVEEEVEEEEIQCQVFIYDNKKYLLDQNNNLYDYESQDPIGELVNGVPKLM